MNKTAYLALALALMLLTACVQPHSGTARALLDPACLTAPVIMEQCDLANHDGPLRCKAVRLRYRKGCERIDVRR